MLNILCYLSIHQERYNSILLFIELFKFSPLPPMILHYRLWGWPCLWAQLQEIFWMLFFIFYVVRFTVKKNGLHNNNNYYVMTATASRQFLLVHCNKNIKKQTVDHSSRTNKYFANYNMIQGRQRYSNCDISETQF